MRSVLVFKKWPRALRTASTLSLAVSSASLLLACGGEGDGSIAANSGAEVLLTAGEAGVVSGTLESVKYRLTNMSWSYMRLAGSNPDLSLVNQDCTVAVKNDWITPTPGAPRRGLTSSETSTSGINPVDMITPPAGSGGSTWECKLVVGSKVNVPTDAVYDLMLSGTNEAGQQVSYKRTLRVKPNPALVSVEQALAVPYDFVIQPVASVCQPGTSISLKAKSQDAIQQGVFYRWRILQGPDVYLAGANTAQVGFITPLVSESTVMVVQLETSKTAFTENNPTSNLATSVVHVDPTYPFPSCLSY